TSIFWRESWKYRDRAYRYCLLDMGHAAGSLLAAARALGLTGSLLGHFGDGALGEFLGLAGTDEEPFLVIPLGRPPTSHGATSSHSPTKGLGAPEGVPNRLSGDQWPFPLSERMHRSTRLPHPPGSCPAPPPVEEPRGEIALPTDVPAPMATPFGEVVRRRRSAVDYDPAHTLSADAFGAILHAATRPYRADWRGNLDDGGAGRPWSALTATSTGSTAWSRAATATCPPPIA
ncbi:MAG: nitroreductase family protein, partial [Nitrospinota bacterium]